MSSDADRVRFVIDETSFDFTDIPKDKIDLFLDQFGDLLSELRSRGFKAWKPPLFADISCLDDKDLYSYLIESVDPDIMRRFFGLLDKINEWDDVYPRCDEAQITDGPMRSAWSICYATTSVLSGHGVACLVFPGSTQSGFLNVASEIGECQIYFLASIDDISLFWRWLYDLEDIPEDEFFHLTDYAFPNLLFHPSLSFRRFQGAYRELRSTVVLHLGELNDHFLDEYKSASASGRVSDIEAYFGARGVGGVSRESVRTHQNSAAMRLREVEFNGGLVMCEWHTKLRPDINRIHFSFGRELDEKILIGIFVDHLPV